MVFSMGAFPALLALGAFAPAEAPPTEVVQREVEAVFSDPFRFDVGRDPNKHLAFGFGVHYCLGAALARMEARALFAELLPRLESIELAGQAEWTATTFVGGLKHLPISYRLKG